MAKLFQRLNRLRAKPTATCLLLVLLGLPACSDTAQTMRSQIASGFVDITKVVPSIALDVRYAGSDNFVGEAITGYERPKIYLTLEAAVALQAVVSELRREGLGLKLFDGYRPQQAVNHFVSWAENLDDIRMKSRYYPEVDKQYLFRDGYISARSGHSRGSTVDLTLITLATGNELDMGSSWDFFDPVSWPSSEAVSQEQRANRMRLQAVMTAHGFTPIRTEWWHFTLANEPYPDQYFDFIIR